MNEHLTAHCVGHVLVRCKVNQAFDELPFHLFICLVENKGATSLLALYDLSIDVDRLSYCSINLILTIHCPA